MIFFGEFFYNTEWFPNITAMVDSGAVYSTFGPETAKHIGLNYKSGKEMKFKFGDGTERNGYFNELLVQIGKYSITTSVVFSDELGLSYNLLGRESVFKHFKVCFDEKNDIITFEPFSNLNGRTLP
ncbi:MAG: hypothetical protein HC887_03990 [Desulfobacteraceae bacterium]|nr:hypothetical protein [Desulfobacteraceae bacterium]